MFTKIEIITAMVAILHSHFSCVDKLPSYINTQ